MRNLLQSPLQKDQEITVGQCFPHFTSAHCFRMFIRKVKLFNPQNEATRIFSMKYQWLSILIVNLLGSEKTPEEIMRITQIYELMNTIMK